MVIGHPKNDSRIHLPEGREVGTLRPVRSALAPAPRRPLAPPPADGERRVEWYAWRMPRGVRSASLCVLVSGVACGSPGADDGRGASGTSSSSTAGSTATGAPTSTSVASTGTTGAGMGPGTSTTGTEATSGTATEGDGGNLLVSDRFLNIAHRGGRALRPEETLPAFANALTIGADVIEFDLHASADGVIVAIHDETVDRTTDGTGAVKNMTFEQLRALDAGYRFTTDDGATFPFRGMGVQISSLEQILTAFPGQYYLMEIKQDSPSIAADVAEILAEHAVLDRVVVASFSSETIADFRAAAPGVFTALSLAEMVALNTNLGDPDYVPPGQFVQPPWESTSKEVIDYAHTLGLKVHPWTVNDAETINLLMGKGVDGIMTDDPALLEGLIP